MSFHADENPSESELAGFLKKTDYPTVWNLAFLRTMVSEAHQPVLFRVQDGDRLAALALGMFHHRFLRSHLLLPSYPRLLSGGAQAKSAFWTGIEEFCRKHLIVRLSVNSYEATEADVPELTGMTWNRPRSEYYVDLTPELDVIFQSFSSNHRRNVRKAQKQGFVCDISQTEDSLQAHLAAFSHTAARRQSRNESIPGVNEQRLRKLLESKSAFMMQLHLDRDIVSSMFIITTDTSAFYYSGGTTADGTKLGAFQYLIWLAIGELRQRGIVTMTLGGTDADTPEGLRRFKLGFNAREVPLMHYEYLEGIAPLRLAFKLKHRDGA